MKLNGNVLVLCARNSARSQMAEALLRGHGGERFDVYSADLEASEIHVLAMRVMEEIGLPLTEQRSKSAREFLGKLAVHHPARRQLHLPMDDSDTSPSLRGASR